MSKRSKITEKSDDIEIVPNQIKQVKIKVSNLPIIQEIGDKSFAKKEDIQNFQSIIEKSEQADAEILTPAEQEVLAKAKALTEAWEKTPDDLPIEEYNIHYENNILPFQQSLAQALVKAYQGIYYPEDPKNHDWAIEESLESGRSYADWEQFVQNHHQYFDPTRKGGEIWYFWESATADVSHYPSLEDLFRDEDNWGKYERIWDDDTNVHVGILRLIKKETFLKKHKEEHGYYGWSEEDHRYYELFGNEEEEELNRKRITRIYKGTSLIELAPDISRFLRPCISFAICLQKANIRTLFPHLKDEFECMRGILNEFAEAYSYQRKLSITRMLAMTYYQSLKKGYLNNITNEKINEIERLMIERGLTNSH